MAMRRPRIKAQANIQLNSKRKSKTVEIAKAIESQSSVVAVNSLNEEARKPIEDSVGPAQQQLSIVADEDVDESVCNAKEVISIGVGAVDTKARNGNNLNNASNNVSCDNDVNEQRGDHASAEAKNRVQFGNFHDSEISHSAEPFKCPPKVEFQRSVSHTSNSGADDVFYSDIEESAINFDMQRSPNGCPMSPSRNQTRQRIKPTPIFGQRRNSFVGSSPNPYASGGVEDVQAYGNDTALVSPQRRERHISSSLSIISNSSTSHHPQKYLPNGVSTGYHGRMRTESGSSVFSDTNTASHKVRKADDHRTSLKREFEARFMNGVPDKSCLKMSDLIYYNPATNPMEQKPNPNIKNEYSDFNISTQDLKPFKEKKEKEEAIDNETEAMPVPQLKLDSNGELILDDKSLVIETTAEQEARKVLANSSLIYLDENTGMNGFYTRQKRTREWKASETVKFYRCLQIVGTDFSLMVTLFPNRTRRDMKLKFKKEERINGNLINKALLHPKQFNIEELKQQLEDEERKREEEADRLKQLHEAKEAARKEGKKRKSVRSSADCTLKGVNIYENENEQQLKRVRHSTSKTQRCESAKKSKTTSQQKTQQLEKNEEADESHTKAIKKQTEKGKRRHRKHKTNVIQKGIVLEKQAKEPTAQQPTQPIKVEIIKNEPIQQAKFKTEHDHLNENLMGIEEEMYELTHSPMNDCNDSIIKVNAETPVDGIAESPISPDSPTYLQGDEYYEEHYEIMDDDCESRTFVNLDDGSVTTVNDVNSYIVNSYEAQEEEKIISQPTPSPSPPSELAFSQHHYADSPLPMTAVQQSLPPSPSTSFSPPDLIINDDSGSLQMSENELNEGDIQQILTELAEGSLFLVSTLHPDDPDKVLNEIFMVDKNTGVLCDEPLNIPDNIVQCILSVMS